MKILVVEDTEDARILLVDLLELHGYEVESAENGVKALEKALASPPGLIISDILMPEMDGFEFCKKVKNEQQLTNIPFIFYTATYTEKSDQNFALSLGASRFIIKPEDPTKLLHAIQKVIAEYQTQNIKSSRQQQTNDTEIEMQHVEVLSRKLDKKVSDLESQKEQLQIITDAIPILISEIDEFGCYQYVNKKYEEWLHISRDEIIGKKLKEVIGDTVYEVIHPFVDKALNGEKSTYEGYISDSNGDYRYILARYIPHKNKDGTTKGCFSFVNDLTDLKLAEKEREELLIQLQFSQKMDALGKVTSGVTHDYNNLLGIILGYADVLKITLGDQLESEKIIQEIMNACERGTKLTRKLLAFSGRDNQGEEKLNINVLLQDEKNMLKTALTARINLVYDLAPDLSTVLLGSNEFDSAVLNICINAMHAIGGNGEVTIHTQNKIINDVDAQQLQLNTGEYVLLSITDTGCGMDEDTKEKIFDPFFTTKGELGTGLGLSQVYGFVQRSGGAIKVFSKPEHGSCFSFYFPKYN